MGDQTTQGADAGKAAAATAASAAAAAGDKSAAGAKQPGTAAVKPGAAAAAEAAAAAAGKKTGGDSILEGSVDHLKDETLGDEGGDTAAAATWPEDWREQAAGGDEKLLRLAKRYGSFNAVLGALGNLRTRLDNGEFKKGLTADATESEIAQFRKDNGIPDKPEGYKVPDGIKVGDEDKPIIENFMKFAHGKNKTPQEVADTISWYYQARDEENAQMFENDKAYRVAQEDSLRAEWGPEFRGNVNGLRGFMKQAFGEELAAALMGARLGDGTLAGNNATFLKSMVGMMKEIAPEQTLTGPGAGGNSKALDERISEIEKQMSTNRDAYFKDEAMQAEYRELIGAREKREKRDKKAA